MVEKVQELEKIHQEYLGWLREESSKFAIADFIKYVDRKLPNYSQFDATGNKALIDEIPRALNRYLDEFEVSIEFRKSSYEYFERMNNIILAL